MGGENEGVWYIAGVAGDSPKSQQLGDRLDTNEKPTGIQWGSYGDAVGRDTVGIL